MKFLARKLKIFTPVELQIGGDGNGANLAVPVRSFGAEQRNIQLFLFILVKIA